MKLSLFPYLAVVALLGAATGPANRGGPLPRGGAQDDRPPIIFGRPAPTGAAFAVIAGDTLAVVDETDGSLRSLSDGMAIEAGYGRKQLEWSPDAQRLLFRRGTPPNADYLVADVASGRTTVLFPDSLRGRLRTFGNIFTGPPLWSPDSRRLALLVGQPDARGSVSAVWVADLDSTPGTPLVWMPVADSLEKTAVVWSGERLLWASRTRSAEIVLTAARLASDGVQVVDSVSLGRGRATDLLPSPNDSLLLVTDASRVAHLVAMSPRLRRIEADLPTGIYSGWLDDRHVLVVRSPSRMTSELASVDVVTGHVTPLVQEDGYLSDVTIMAGRSGTMIAYSREDGAQPKSYLAAAVQAPSRLGEARPLLPLAWRAVPEPWDSRVVRWGAADGRTTLEAQLLRPGEGTPVGTVIAPYGGYLNKALTETYFLDALLRELLGAGWQVIRPNTLGLPQTSGYGRVQLRDTERLVDTLATAGLLAPDRVAVIGHSHGGSMAYYYATHSSRFCAVVAINGRADWVMQAQHEGDGLLPGPLGATPEADPALYREASPAANAGRVRARLLMVAGQLDGQILPANVRTMADSLRAYGKPVDSLVFMDEGHQIDEPAHRAALWEATQRLLRSGCGT